MKAQKARSVYATFLFALIGLHVSFFLTLSVHMTLRYHERAQQHTERQVGF